MKKSQNPGNAKIVQNRNHYSPLEPTHFHVAPFTVSQSKAFWQNIKVGYPTLRYLYILFFFLLFHQLADNEALIILLQTSPLLAFPYAIDNCMPSKTSLTLSLIHLFLGLPLLLSPLTCPCSAAFGSLFPSILSTCPNHVCIYSQYAYLNGMEGYG